MSFLRAFFKKETTDLNELSKRLEAIESQIRLLKLEWTETYDKITHAIERWSKRELKAKQGLTPAEPEITTHPPNFDGPRLYTDEELIEMSRKRGMLG